MILKWNKKRRGFTLVELAIVIAILGILALYALPKYQGMVKEARSSEAKAQLGSVRSALGIYYAKNHGVYPATLGGTIFAEGSVPEVEDTVGGAVTRGNDVKQVTNGDGTVTHSDVTNADGWVYAVSDGTNSNIPQYSTADVRINSDDTDPADSNTEGKSWYEY